MSERSSDDVTSGLGSPGRPLRVGVLGCGNVGAALVGLLTDDSSGLAAHTGVVFEVAKIGVRNLSVSRGVQVSAELLTRDTQAMVSDPEIDIIVETIGGIEPARTLLLTALKNGKPVITANKELVANCGGELFETAASAGVDFFFEAAVAGGIPVMRALQRSLAGEQITKIMGIVNGTTNFILTKMTDEGAAYADVLSEAQQLGYAEADPTADVEGFDAGAKAAIMASIAFGVNVVAGDVYQEGISRITPNDIAAAARVDHVIKLLAIIERYGNEVAVRVHPAMVPNTHPLATVRDSFNAVFIHGETVDDVMLYGRGAGGGPTASAMLGDLLTAASNLRRGSASDPIQLKPAKVMAIDQTSSAFYLALDVADHSGVLAEVAAVFGAHDVSIRSMEQHGVGHGARITFITHLALEADVQATLSDLSDLNAVHDVGAVIRVIGG